MSCPHLYSGRVSGEVPDVLQPARRRAGRRRPQRQQPDDVAGQGRRDGVAGAAAGDVKDIQRVAAGARSSCVEPYNCSESRQRALPQNVNIAARLGLPLSGGLVAVNRSHTRRG